jgi:hypothetical protein
MTTLYVDYRLPPPSFLGLSTDPVLLPSKPKPKWRVRKGLGGKSGPLNWLEWEIDLPTAEAFLPDISDEPAANEIT